MKRKNLVTLLFAISISVIVVNAQSGKFQPLFNGDLTNADYPAGVWSIEDGILTATEDQ
jgi:hypothetical protein